MTLDYLGYVSLWIIHYPRQGDSSLLLEQFVEDVAKGAGEILRSRFRTNIDWRSKSTPGDVVTSADIESERYVLGRIKDEYPDDCILSEESGESGGQCGRLWIVDPLDGTRNFTMGIPFFCVSIALVEAGEPTCGVVYDPIHDELFLAARGSGAFLNGERIEVSSESSIEDGIISVSWVKHKGNHIKFIEYIEEISRDTSYFRRFGAAALVMAYVAAGRVHGYLQGGLHPWDVAAGLLILKEAGALVTDFQGRPVNLLGCDIEIVTGSAQIHSILLNDVIAKRA